MNTENNTQQAKKAAGWLSGLLSGWGVPANWARLVSGAIIGALATLAAMYGTGCTASYSQAADGSINYCGAIAPANPNHK